MQFGTVYAAGALDPARVVRKAIDGRLGEHKFDTLVGTGLSGALVIPQLAQAFDVQWAIVRKPGDGSHSEWKVEGSIGKRWVFVDDQIEGGATFRYVHDTVCELFYGPFKADWDYKKPDHGTEFAGAWLYQGDGRWRSVEQAIDWAQPYGNTWEPKLGEVLPYVNPFDYPIIRYP